MAGRLYLWLLLVSLSFLDTDAASCEPGWTPYKDELCITNSNTQVTYNEARDHCASLDDDATLVMVKDPEYQNYLLNYTYDIYNTLWLGGRYDNATGEYVWEDGDPLTYTDWAEGYPHNGTEVEYCIEFRPPLSKAGGRWATVPCLKQNMIMCQKPLQWTLKDAVDAIKRIRKQHEDDMADVNSRVIPIGSTYVEYAFHVSPTTLWPGLVWEDVTSWHQGLFFRALGGGSEEWEVTQTECAPRITKMGYLNVNDGNATIPNEVEIPEQGWSPWVKAGMGSDSSFQEEMRVYTDKCEVRPRNQAIRIWRRIT